ncbi:AMP-binding protein [Bordetella petrii]|nr:AMP-binding protein [Bordetella petrii]
MTTRIPEKSPWASLHPPAFDTGGQFKAGIPDALTLFRRAAEAGGSRPAIHYFDATIDYARLDAMSDAFAAFLLENGIAPGDRVALYMQNIPQFVICMLGAWKAGAIAVSINPMNRSREVRLLLQDSGARALVLQRDLYAEVGREVLADFPGVLAVTTSPREFQRRDDPRVMPADGPSAGPGAVELMDALRTPVGTHPLRQAAAPDETAVLVYTSGTTGIPKGAMVTHNNIAFNVELWNAWVALSDGTPILGLAPLFHITGLVAVIAFPWIKRAPSILSLRFHPEVVAEAGREHGAGFTVGAITAFIAMMNSPSIGPEHFASLESLYTGGAPVPASVALAFKQKFGKTIRNTYGLTESTALAVGVPRDRDTPVDANGAYSIGVPVYDTDAYIADDAGRPLPPGEIGEILLRGAQIVPGYWQRPDDTQAAFHQGFLRTGDVGYMNEDGWLFIVDRKKDMINASGYKVWPKEVEDVIYSHPAVLEAAVVGVPDGYRGETVKAVVSLKPGHALAEQDLIDFCKKQMAAYKYPRQVEIVEELPKTSTGKILRRALRQPPLLSP